MVTQNQENKPSALPGRRQRRWKVRSPREWATRFLRRDRLGPYTLFESCSLMWSNYPWVWTESGRWVNWWWCITRIVSRFGGCLSDVLIWNFGFGKRKKGREEGFAMIILDRWTNRENRTVRRERRRPRKFSNGNNQFFLSISISFNWLNVPLIFGGN